MAAIRNINIYKGDTYTHEVTINDSSNSAIDISGRTYTAQIRRAASSSSVTLSFTTTIVDAAAGQLQLSLTSTQTSTLQAGNYTYDLQETNGSTILTLMYGDVVVTGDVSR